MQEAPAGSDRNIGTGRDQGKGWSPKEGGVWGCAGPTRAVPSPNRTRAVPNLSRPKSGTEPRESGTRAGSRGVVCKGACFGGGLAPRRLSAVRGRTGSSRLARGPAAVRRTRKRTRDASRRAAEAGPRGPAAGALGQWGCGSRL